MHISLNDLSPMTDLTYQQDQDNLISASNDAAKIKPFISLKRFTADTRSANQHAALTPASGMAIITYVLAGAATYADSTGKQGVLDKDGWAWMIAGSGIWYSIEPATSDYVAMQVCIALSPALENSLPRSAYMAPAISAPHEPTQVLIGWHGKQRSEFAIPAQVNYLVVHLNAHQQWCYDLPLNHQFAWIALISGSLTTSAGDELAQGVTVFNRAIGTMDFHASADAILVVGSAQEFDYDLVAYNNSVHTSSEALHLGLQGIAATANT